jgi:hypothetical protein
VNTGTIGHPDRDTLAAYSLGALGTDETASYEPHLRTCPSCREYLDELTVVRDMLSRVPASLVLDDPSLAGDAPEAAPRRTTPRRTTPRRARRTPAFQGRWVPAAAIAAAAVVGAFVIPNLVNGGGTPAEPGATATSTATAVVVTRFDTSTRVTATMRLQAEAADSRFTLDLTNVAPGTTLRVVADLTDGTSLIAGQWHVPAGDSGTVLELDKSVPVTADKLTDFRVLTSTGTVLVTLTMPGR